MQRRRRVVNKDTESLELEQLILWGLFEEAATSRRQLLDDAVDLMVDLTLSQYLNSDSDSDSDYFDPDLYEGLEVLFNR